MRFMGVHADSRAFRTLNPGESPAQPPSLLQACSRPACKLAAPIPVGLGFWFLPARAIDCGYPSPLAVCHSLSRRGKRCNCPCSWLSKATTEVKFTHDLVWPSSFDRFFAKCTAISTTTITTKKPMEIKNPLDSTIEISIPLYKFHRIFLSFSLCPCYVPVWRSQQPNKGFPSLLCCCPVQHDSTNSCIVDGLPREHLSILPMKTHKLHWLIHARFL